MLRNASWSTPTSIRIKPHISATCAMPCWAIRLCACFAGPGSRVEVQNYIDNTGVQVADVVIGFLHIAKKTAAEVRALAAEPKFDYYCWDLYASVSRFFEEDKARLNLRGEMLKSIEEGAGGAAEMANIVAPAIVRCHLRTMERLGIEYDLLPRESEILHLKFWDAAFELLKQRNAIHWPRRERMPVAGS